MSKTIEINEAEINRLERILKYGDLEKQKRIAHLFFGAAIVFLVLGIFEVGDNSTVRLILRFSFSFVLFIMGMARLGYYKLFRLIHFQESQKDNDSL